MGRHRPCTETCEHPFPAPISTHILPLFSFDYAHLVWLPRQGGLAVCLPEQQRRGARNSFDPPCDLRLANERCTYLAAQLPNDTVLTTPVTVGCPRSTTHG